MQYKNLITGLQSKDRDTRIAAMFGYIQAGRDLKIPMSAYELNELTPIDIELFDLMIKSRHSSIIIPVTKRTEDDSVITHLSELEPFFTIANDNKKTTNLAYNDALVFIKTSTQDKV